MIPIQDLALAYELRTMGCCWKLIGIGLGHETEKLKDAVRYRTHKKEMRPLDHKPKCDICGRQRSVGVHTKCSQIRQRATMHTQTKGVTE